MATDLIKEKPVSETMKLENKAIAEVLTAFPYTNGIVVILSKTP